MEEVDKHSIVDVFSKQYKQNSHAGHQQVIYEVLLRLHGNSGNAAFYAHMVGEQKREKECWYCQVAYAAPNALVKLALNMGLSLYLFQW